MNNEQNKGYCKDNTAGTTSLLKQHSLLLCRIPCVRDPLCLFIVYAGRHGSKPMPCITMTDLACERAGATPSNTQDSDRNLARRVMYQAEFSRIRWIVLPRRYCLPF